MLRGCDGFWWCMLIDLKSKLLGPHVWKDEYMDREMGKSFLPPHAG